MALQSPRILSFLIAMFVLGACAAPPAGVLPNQPAKNHRIAALGPNGYALLYAFKGAPDAFTPLWGSLTVLDGKLYGTTENGGSGCYSGNGCGAVFSVTPSGDESVVYSFKGDTGGCDGEDPWGPVVAKDNTLYGTTSWGGCTYGTVFALTPSGREDVLFKFTSYTQGGIPIGGLTPIKDNLYGTTQSGGGPCGCGEVFDVTTSGKERNVYEFASGNDGSAPNGINSVDGVFHGTTSGGGRNNWGTVFSIDASGKERVLYSFKGGPDGALPVATSLTALHDVLYGTTLWGGEACSPSSLGCGTVFSIDSQGREKVIYRFKGGNDGRDPSSSLVAVKGVLYGTTQGGGKHCGCGTIFKITTSGKEQVLYSFKGPPDGADPWAGLTLFDGKLYGTTSSGGSKAGQCGNSGTLLGGCGTIFQISP